MHLKGINLCHTQMVIKKNLIEWCIKSILQEMKIFYVTRGGILGRNLFRFPLRHCLHSQMDRLFKPKLYKRIYNTLKKIDIFHFSSSFIQ